MYSTADRAARGFLFSGILWLVLFMSMGLIIAVKQLNPDFFAHMPWLTYGRVRMVHVNGVLFGWLSMGLIGSMFYIIPRLCRTQLFSSKLATFTLVCTNILIVSMAVTLLAGLTTGIEYGEMIWPLDILVAVIAVTTLYNCVMTVAKRKENQLYVSIWYFIGSLIWLPLVYIIGNIPSEWIGGIQQANMNWFYGHNVIGLWFTTVGIGTIYYLLPILTKAPLYSHRMSMIGFWTIATFYVWNGPHHLVNGPIPLWLMKAGIVPSLLLIIPVWTVVANVFGTLKGHWHQVRANNSLKFLVTGTIFYLITCIQGPFQALMGPSSVLKFTEWVPGHAHMPLFGAFSSVVFAMIYYMLEKQHGKIHSRGMQEVHFYFSVVGYLFFGFSMWIAGVIQGFSWIDGEPFMASINAIKSLNMVRGIGGGFMLLGQIFFAINVWKTVKQQRISAQDLESDASVRV
ncbi:MAG TPA: cbb3-type cytochrome c oxidase subunit I [Bacilli bacterium]|nr:cbb3-type cytochrome c oxidase subunit I [Bacilli bacterium]